VLVRSDSRGIDYCYGPRDTPFHAASVGKLATTMLAMHLVDEGAISLGTTAQSVLGGLDGILLGDATLRQLLDHTSGAADYFEGKVTSGPTFLRFVIDEPDRLWQPRDLLDFSRARQVPVGRPGERFHYSDTGYIIVGLMLEEVTGRSFHELLHERIFGPLGMDDTWMMWRSNPTSGGDTAATAPLWLDRIEASGFRSVSCDWAGGGIISTLDDLAKLGAAIRGGFVSAAALAEMSRARHRFRPGIHYGTGMMQLRFEGFFFLLRGLPRLLGHSGVLGTHLFFDPVSDVHIVMNFHSTREVVRSFRTLIRIVQMLRRELRRR
jgi:D-alanyl-D-alanine carboxypeptidase